MTKVNDFEVLDDTLAGLFGGELESLEGEQDAAALFERLQGDPQARARYDAVVLAMRMLAGRDATVKSFGDEEADVLWPVVAGGVAQDASRRTGLSRRALMHMEVPNLVASITQAIVNFHRVQPAGAQEVVFETAVSSQADEAPLNFSIAAVGGQVSLRLYRNEGQEVDFVANVSPSEMHTNVDTSEIGAWSAVSEALTALSSMTHQLLGDETLLNGRIDIKQGRAEVRMQPLNLGLVSTKR
jgi:hypothetical protein